MTDLPGSFETALADRYTIERKLGEGGMGVVYLARDLQHDRQVAFKVMKPELAAGVGRERFLREIATTAGLDHPHILPLFDSGEVDGWLFYVMPYVAGESLRTRLEREKLLPIEEAVRLGSEICSAVQYASERGIVHRDLKPDNILLSAGHARVADFGIAAAMGSAAKERLTDAGSFVGTMEYLSPEQATGESVDSRSDVYAVAVMVFEMLTGEPPFTGPNATAVLAKKVTQEVPPIRPLRETVSPELEGVVIRGLARLPVDRFRTPGELGEALKQALSEGTSERTAHTGARPAASVGRRTRWVPVSIATGLATAALAIGAFLGLRSSGAPEPERIAVLPFQDRMGDTSQTFIVAGLHEALIGQLSRRPRLAVIARTSVMAYQDSDKPVSVIADELRADALVSGSVAAVGDSLLVSIEVIEPTNQTTRLTEQYRAAVGDLAVLPERIARRVSSAMGVARAAAPSAMGSAEVDPEALTAFLKAQFHVNRGTLADLDLARQLLDTAVVEDPEFAPPHALLAALHNNSAFLGVEPHLAFGRGKVEARRALELDPSLPEAHLHLAYALATYDWDWAGAEEEFETALELNPSFAYGHGLYGTFLAWMGRIDEAVEHARTAVVLDPVSLYPPTQLAGVLYFARRYREAVSQAEEVILSVPEFVLAYDWLAGAHEALGDVELAVAAAEEAVKLSGNDPRRLSVLARIYVKAGRTAEARSILDDLLRRREAGEASPLTLAWVYTALGEDNEALDWLERAYRLRDPVIVSIRAYPVWDSLRSNPRFQALVQRLRFPT